MKRLYFAIALTLAFVLTTAVISVAPSGSVFFSQDEPSEEMAGEFTGAVTHHATTGSPAQHYDTRHCLLKPRSRKPGRFNWVYTSQLTPNAHHAFDHGFGLALLELLGSGSVVDVRAGLGQLGCSFVPTTRHAGTRALMGHTTLWNWRGSTPR